MKDLRVNYTKGQLIESELELDAIDQFLVWFKHAENANFLEANAMVLSTSLDNDVSSRTVLLKGVENGKFIFFTNYNSQKGQQLAENDHCSLLFPWYALERQIIIKGKAQRLSAQASDEYFYSRPLESQLGAIASSQSATISSRKELEARFSEVEKLKASEIKRPSHWGGYEVSPHQIEFWQGRENRLHDRIQYRLDGKVWKISRLQP